MCGMNEVACTNIRKEMKTLAEVKHSGITGFQETFQVKLEIHYNTEQFETGINCKRENGKILHVRNKIIEYNILSF